jgi:hypothetical protein
MASACGMTAGYHHSGMSDACLHLLGAVGEAHVKKLTVGVVVTV